VYVRNMYTKMHVFGQMYFTFSTKSQTHVISRIEKNLMLNFNQKSNLNEAGFKLKLVIHNEATYIYKAKQFEASIKPIRD